MKLRSHRSRIDSACREAWRLRELGCDGGPQVQAVMLYAVALALKRPVESLPCPDPDQLWMAFRSAIDCKAVQLTDLPLPLLSFGERFALAIGTVFKADHLPRGETYLELVESATGGDAGPIGIFLLEAVLSFPVVQAVVPDEVLTFHGATAAREESCDEIVARAREAMDAIA